MAMRLEEMCYKKVIGDKIEYSSMPPNMRDNLSNMKKYYSIQKIYKGCGWAFVCNATKLPEQFIRMFHYEITSNAAWSHISRRCKLSEDFIRDFQDKVDWIFISIYQKLSEKFIREFENKVCWNGILRHQQLSKKFIREIKGKIDLNEDMTKITEWHKSIFMRDVMGWQSRDSVRTGSARYDFNEI